MLPSTHLPIQEAAAKFDWSCISDLLAKATDERREVIDQFPRESWPSLPLEHYALGQENRSRGTFCWWLEYATKNIGRMGERAAARLLIYKRLKQSDWYFDQSQFSDEQAAWQAIRAGIVEALEKAQAGQWDLIDNITALQGATALRLKTLFIYAPNDLLPITAPDHLRHYLRLLHPAEEEDKNLGAVQLNRKLLVTLREVLALRERSPQEMEKFLYRWADPRENRLVVKISPGHDAMYWPDCEREGMICVGWDRVGDLLAYENKAAYKEAFLTAYADEYTTTQKAGTKANELWTLRELGPGDIVIANQGTSRVLAVGEVVGPGYRILGRCAGAEPLHRSFLCRHDLKRASVCVRSQHTISFQKVVTLPPMKLLFTNFCCLYMPHKLSLFSPKPYPKHFD